MYTVQYTTVYSVLNITAFGQSMEELKLSGPIGVNLIYAAGGDPLCSLHRGKGVYG